MSPRRYGAVLAVVVAGAVTVAGLGWWFAGDERAGRTDRHLAGLVEMRAGTIKTVGQGLANLGSPVPIGIALLVLAVLAHRYRGPRGLALVLIGPPASMITTSVLLKPFVDRTRGGELAFPSGHTTSVASMAVTTGVLLVSWMLVPPLVRGVGATALVALVVGVGASLVGRGYHYPTDTLGGVGVAVAVVLTTAVLVDEVVDRWPRPGRWGDPVGDDATEVLPALGGPPGPPPSRTATARRPPGGR